LSFNKL